jgi:non-ribosomal peptide synthase protein (TIGR01720 family)
VPAAYRTRIDDVLLTALTQACAPWTGTSALLVDLEGHGREPLFEDVDLSRTVGWFTAMFPVVLDLDHNRDRDRDRTHAPSSAGSGPASGPEAALKAINEQLRHVPGRGLGYGLLRYLCRDGDVATALRALPRPEVSFNYLGRTDPPPDGAALFRPGDAGTGPLYDPRSRRSHLIDVVGDVAGDRLQLRWIYSEAMHRRETIEALATAFLDALQALIATGRAPGTGGLTPSDFPRARLDQRQLDSFLAGLAG